MVTGYLFIHHKENQVDYNLQ